MSGCQILAKIKYRPPPARRELTLEFAEMAGITNNPEFMMTREEVQTLDRNPLFEVGAHTINHPILASIPDDEARQEIAEGKVGLEAMLDRKVDLFAYPNGKPGEDFQMKHVAMVKEAGFSIAVTTSAGGVRNTISPLQWPRQSIWQKEPRRASANIIRGCRDYGDVLVG